MVWISAVAVCILGSLTSTKALVLAEDFTKSCGTESGCTTSTAPSSRAVTLSDYIHDYNRFFLADGASGSCGTEFGCVTIPENCDVTIDESGDEQIHSTCDAAVLFRTENPTVTNFLLIRKQSTIKSENNYVAVGFTDTPDMRNASVSGCVTLGSASPALMLGYNDPRFNHNTQIINYPDNLYDLQRAGIIDNYSYCRFTRYVAPLSTDIRIFPLNKAYFMLLAYGPADDRMNLQHHDSMIVSNGKASLGTPGNYTLTKRALALKSMLLVVGMGILAVIGQNML